jgi:hypothetical protein
LLLGQFLVALWFGLAATARAQDPPAPPAASPLSADPPAASFERDVLPFLESFCFECHGRGANEADLALDRYRTNEDLLRDRQRWTDGVVAMLSRGEMPPPEARSRPSPERVAAVLRAIDGVLNSFDCEAEINVGRVTLRRLNRFEYDNTIRDLLGVDFHPAEDFPLDDVGYGFDNIGDVLSVSTLLLEKYFQAAETILDQVIVRYESPAPSETNLSDLRIAPQTAGSARGARAGRGRRGGPFLHDEGEIFGRTNFLAGDYTIRVDVAPQHLGDQSVHGVVRVDGVDVLPFTIDYDLATTLETTHHFPIEGSRQISVAFLNPFVDPNLAPLVEPEPVAGRGGRDAARGRRGGQRGQRGAARGRGPTIPDANRRALYVARIAVEGPFDPPSPPFDSYPEPHRRLLAQSPDVSGREAAREIIARFAPRAFRRPVSPEEIEATLATYDAALAEGESFEDGVRLAIVRMLISPHFLFRVELDPPGLAAGDSYAIGEFELASRLSYFLWSTMPDERLFALAGEGQLRANLADEVRRMLADEKSAALVESFAGQWLTLRKLTQAAPDSELFPDFDDELLQAMWRETELFFGEVVRDDMSVLALLDADFTLLNERLARHYGVEGVRGDEFRKVAAPAERGGVLTHASVLTLTSHATRTAPVLRGKFILEQILGAPPPQPPANVPPLEEGEALSGSLREVLEQHRENALCASCHDRMDPLGFALENFDAIGRWRTEENGRPIDVSASLPDGREFQGAQELRALLLEKKDLFAANLSGKMLTYAIGRGLEYYDQCAVDAIELALADDDYRFSTLILEVVRSDPFQRRTALGE